MDKNPKLESINEKMKELNAKVKDSAETVAIMGLEAKDTIDEKYGDSEEA